MAADKSSTSKKAQTKDADKHSVVLRYERKGIYILPNLFTTANMFAGFYAIVLAMNGSFENAPLAIFVAMVLDGLDGRVARWTHTESDFGAQYDSLVDMISFGLAPALIMYEWALSGLGKVGWLAAFIFSVCAALRLARFNTQLATSDKTNFVGLPSPSAAAVVVGFVWVLHSYGVPGREISLLAFIVTVAAGLLMTSNISYRSFKDFNVKDRVSFIYVLAIPLVFVFIFIDPPQTLFTVFALYALSGPAIWAYHFFRDRKNRDKRNRNKKESA